MWPPMAGGGAISEYAALDRKCASEKFDSARSPDPVSTQVHWRCSVIPSEDRSLVTHLGPVKTVFGSIAWTPLTPSTTWVTCRSAAALVSM